ncbi:unnamed protein product [marine sediment metagenome]|uniref:Uncharacterized protein n=1 Tax=marine sediment metagenome TaxID=412755 RepID=X1ENA3_9ZZZZ
MRNLLGMIRCGALPRRTTGKNEVRKSMAKMKNMDVRIKWGAFEYKGSVDLLAFVMDILFERMPPDADYGKRVIEQQKEVSGCVEGYD